MQRVHGGRHDSTRVDAASITGKIVLHMLMVRRGRSDDASTAVQYQRGGASGSGRRGGGGGRLKNKAVDTNFLEIAIN